MEYTHVLVRFGELTTKGKNKKDFISVLTNNIRKSLEKYEALKYDKQHDRLFIELNGVSTSEVAEKLDKVFGLSSYSFAIKTANDLQNLKDVAYMIAMENDYKTFKLKANRQDKTYPYTSDEVNRHIAGHILANSNLKVDVHNPDILIAVDIRKDDAYLMSNKIIGLGGYPVGTSGKAMMMISGGIDSPVAAFMTLKRGVRIECIHFESSPYTSIQALNKVYDLCKILTAYQPEIVVHTIPFTKLQLEIYKYTPESYAITILRRMMYRIADKMCDARGFLAISNGESLGQVASQTIESAYVIGSVTDKVIYRPLAMYDKMEIIEVAKKIGTFETSILPFEDCCTIFEPKAPVTKPKMDRCEYYESKFDYETLINEAIENEKVIRIDANYNNSEDLF